MYFKIHFCFGNPPLCGGVMGVPSGSKSHTFTVILAVFATGQDGIKNREKLYFQFKLYSILDQVEKALIVWFQKLSIPPPRKGFFPRLLHLSGNSSQASYIYLSFWAFENPPPPRNFQSLLWG